jgi:hypothetical protein
MAQGMLKVAHQAWKTLISLKFAVVVMVMLTLSLIVATFIESNVDTKTAQYYVYRTWWFFALLGSFGALILAVAISRWPWKKKHTPFLMAHAGILMILAGSWLTYVKGVDGSMQLTEGEVSSSVELDQQVLVFKKNESMHSVEFPWMPASVAEKFKPITYPEFGVKVEQLISDSMPNFQFNPAPAGNTEKTGSAVLVKILGAPMGGAPEVWMWTGDPAWATQKMGPARFLIRSADTKLPPSEPGEARFEFIVSKKGDLSFEAISPRGEKRAGKIQLSGADPVVINPGWRMPIQLMVKQFVPVAVNQTNYISAKERSNNPVPAIQVSLIENPASKLWLALGDRAEFTSQGVDQISVGYFQKRVILPFALRLKNFEMKHNPGTMDPSAYASHVQVIENFQKSVSEMDALPVHTIQMNEPLKSQGFTFYQASYIPDFPRVTTTVLSVNQDPGRFLKYSGSLLLVLGSILLYLSKVVTRKKAVVAS